MCLFNGFLWKWPSEATATAQCKRACTRLAHDEGREVVGPAGDARDARQRRSDRQGRSGTALATDQPQEGRSATDGPDTLEGPRKAAFVFETWMYLPEMEVANRPAEQLCELFSSFVTQ